MASAPRKKFIFTDLYDTRDRTVNVPVSALLRERDEWQYVQPLIVRILKETFPDVTIERSGSNEMIISFPAETTQVSSSNGDLSPPITFKALPSLQKGDIPFKSLIKKDPKVIGIGFKVYGDAPAPVPAPAPAPAPAMASASRKRFIFTDLYDTRDRNVKHPLAELVAQKAEWNHFRSTMERALKDVFPDVTIEPSDPNQLIISFPANAKQVPESNGDISPRIILGGPDGIGLQKRSIYFKMLDQKDPKFIGMGFKIDTGDAPAPVPAPVPAPAPAPAPATPNVTGECGPPASVIPPTPPPSAKLLPVFPDVTKDRVRDTFEELQKKYPSMPYLQPPNEVDLGGGYCAAWSLWIQSKLIKLSAEEYWNLPYEARQDVYARVIYGLNPTTSRFLPIGTLQMKADLEQTIVPGKRVLAPRSRKNPTTGKAETLTPGRSPFNPAGSVPMIENFAEKVMRPATQNSDAPFRWISAPGGYHIIDKRPVYMFGEFVNLNNTTPDPKPILFNVSVKAYKGGNHALCFVYFPKSHEIDIVSTYAISSTMSKYDAIEAMYENRMYNADGTPFYPLLNSIERQLHLPITPRPPRPAGRRRTFRKKASKRKTRRRRTIRR